MTRTSAAPASLHRPALPGRRRPARSRWSLSALALAAIVAWILAAPNAAAQQPEPAHGAAAQAAATGAAPQQPAEAGHAVQPAEAGHTAQPAEAGHGVQAGEGGEHGEEGHEAESPWGLIGKIVNFAILAGALVYLLRSPFAQHLQNRATRIRGDLANARQLRDEASARMAQIDERLKALPSEIEALKRRGAAEVAAEQMRMREAAEAERQRLIDQTRREVESQVRTAERMLLKRAGELAVAVATERVRRTITEADQARLVDRYLSQVGT